MDTHGLRELSFMGHFSILLPDVVGTMVADEPPEDLFEVGWLSLRNLADRIEDVSISDEEAGEHWQMLTDVWLSGRGIEIASQRIGLSLRGINNWWTPSNKRCEMKKYCFKCCGGRGETCDVSCCMLTCMFMFNVLHEWSCWHGDMYTKTLGAKLNPGQQDQSIFVKLTSAACQSGCQSPRLLVQVLVSGSQSVSPPSG